MNFKQIEQNHEAFQASPTAWPRMLAAIAGGVNPLKACETAGLDWYTLNIWISADAARRSALNEALASRSEYLRYRLEAEWEAVGLFDYRTLFDGENHLKPVSEWPAEIGAAVAGLEVEEMFDTVEAAEEGTREKVLSGYLKKLKLWDKDKASDKLAKQHGMLGDAALGRVADGLEALLEKSWDKPKEA